MSHTNYLSVRRHLLSSLVPFLIFLFVTSAYTQQTATVTEDGMGLNGTPSATGKVISKLVKGAKVEILLARGEWNLVQSDDYVGWIPARVIAIYDTSDIRFPSSTPATLKSSTQLPPPSTTTVPSSPPSSSHVYIRGPRGGCYYINSRGNKTYVDRSLCN